MRLGKWLTGSRLILGLLVVPARASAQTVKEADLVGGWLAELEHEDSIGRTLGPRGWLVLWPDHLWWYGGAFMVHGHGGARWRLVGDTLWLSNDFEPYFHPMIQPRIEAIQAKGYGLGVMDMGVIRDREPFEVPDSVYWSKDFRDFATDCALADADVCGTWVYKVTMKGRQISLVRLDSLSRATVSVATKGLLTRDTLVNCTWMMGCR